MDEIQLPSAKEAADREALKFYECAAKWSSMSKAEIQTYPLGLFILLDYRRLTAIRYMENINEREVLKSILVEINTKIKLHLNLL